MKRPTLWFMALAILLTTLSCSTEDINHKPENVTIDFVIPEPKVIEIEILELLNNYRLSLGLNTLDQFGLIRSQTFSHTEYMIETSNLSHAKFNQRSTFLKDNAGANRVSENIAYGYSSPESVVNAWLNSDSHRGAIEGDYTHFDITAAQDENGYWYFTNIFIKK